LDLTSSAGGDGLNADEVLEAELLPSDAVSGDGPPFGDGAS